LIARVSDPALLPDLEAHLRRMGCEIEPVAEDSLLVEIPEAQRRDAAELELDLYLRLWEAKLPLARAERVA
jgi:hypothetical protein